MSKYATKEEEFTAKLLADHNIFTILYWCISYAGRLTTDELETSPEMNNLTFLPIETKGITRSSKPFFCNYKNIRIAYDWKDLSIVGGSAITALEIVTQKNTKKYLDVQTADIDIVWWPRQLYGYDLLPIVAQKAPTYPAISEDGRTIISDNYDTFLVSNYDTELRKKEKYCVTSLSPAIIHLSRTYAKHLQQTLTQYVIGNKDYMIIIYNICYAYYGINPLAFITHFTVETSCDTKLLSTDSREISTQKTRALKGSILSGSWNVVVYMEFPAISLRLKIIDIAIHDECSSQKSDTLVFGNLDPIYTSYSAPNSIIDIQIPRSQFSMRIPPINRLLEQQFFALQNRIRDYWINKQGDVQKVLTHHRRIQYIIDILTHALRTGSAEMKAFLIKILQIKPSMNEYYDRDVNNIMIKMDEWIASCPIYNPPILPCSESVKGNESIKQCSLQTCKISLGEESQFKKLCDNNKVLQKELCSVQTTSIRKTNSKKRHRK